jgi:WD40 repeat protein
MVHMPHNESVNIWDAHSGALIRNLPGPAGPRKIENNANALAFSPDSRLIAVGYFPQGNRTSVHVFDVETGKRLQIMHPSGLAHSFLTFLDGGNYVGYENDGFNIHDVLTGKQVQRLGEPGVYALSPDGRSLATRSNTEQKLRIIDRKTGREVRVLDTDKGYYRVLAYSPDGRYLAVNSDDGLLIWDLSAGRIVSQLKGHPDIVGRWIGFDAEGKYFAAVCNKYVVVWDFNKLISARRAD